jgi:hypothetical protein
MKRGRPKAKEIEIENIPEQTDQLIIYCACNQILNIIKFLPPLKFEACSLLVRKVITAPSLTSSPTSLKVLHNLKQQFWAAGSLT